MTTGPKLRAERERNHYPPVYQGLFAVAVFAAVIMVAAFFSHRNSNADANDLSFNPRAYLTKTTHRLNGTSVREVARINWAAPKMISLGETMNVDVAIRRPTEDEGDMLPAVPADKDRTNLGLPGGAELGAAHLAAGDVMQMILSAEEPDAFDVAARDSDSSLKSLKPGGGAQWHWRATPKKAGTFHLLLHAEIVEMTRDGKALPPVDQGTWSATITVNVLPWHKRLGTELGSLWKENWKAILRWAALPGGVCPILLAARLKKRSKTKANSPAALKAPLTKRRKDG